MDTDVDVNRPLSSLFSSDISKGITHYNLECGSVKLNLPTQNVPKFWKDYCFRVDEEEQCFIAESIGQSPIPIIVLIEFSIDYDPQTDCTVAYDRSLIKNFVFFYQEVIREKIRINSESDLTCVVLEYDQKKEYIEKARRKYLIRLQFPHVKVDVQFQNDMKFDFVKKLRAENALGSFLVAPIESLDEMVHIPKGFVPLYGSSRFRNEPPLMITSIYRCISQDEKDIFLHDHTNDDLFTLALDGDSFQLYYHQDFSKGLINTEDLEINTVGDLQKAIPIFLSLGYWSVLGIPLKSQQSSIVNNIGVEESLATKLSPLGVAIEMLPLLSEDLFRQEFFFLEIGKALKNVSLGDEGFDLWKKYNTLFSAEKLSEIWNCFEADGMITHKTLAWYAKISSPERYKEWYDLIMGAIMKNSFTLTNADVGYAIYMSNWLDLTCARERNGVKWYSFTKNHWHYCGKEEIMRRVIEDFVKKLEHMRMKLIMESQPSDSNSKLIIEVTKTSIDKLIVKIKGISFLRSCVDMSTIYFLNDNFMSFEHKNQYITAFNNCVFEVYQSKLDDTCGNNNVLVKRAGKPEDYITTTTQRNYEEFAKDSPLVAMYENFIRKILPDIETRIWFERFCSSLFIGGNPDKILPIWVGKLANNGKSTLITTLTHAIGPLCVKVPTSLFTGRRGKSGDATAELVRLKYARLAFGQEPSINEEIRSGPIKELTGNDTIYIRALFQEGMDIVNQAKFILVSNNDTPVDFPDRAMVNRFRVVGFSSVFTDTPPVLEEMREKLHIYKIDKNLDAKLHNFAKVLVWKAVNGFPTYAKEGLGTSSSIEKLTENYWTRNDVFKSFFRKHIEKGTPSESINTLDAYGKFQGHFTYTSPGKDKKIPGIQIFTDNLVPMMGEPSIDDKWYGWKYRCQSKVSIVISGTGI